MSALPQLFNLFELTRDPNCQQLLDLLPDSLLLIDETGAIIYGNQGITALLGYHPDELIGRPIEVLIPKATQHHHQYLRENYLTDPTPRAMGFNKNLQAATKDEQIIPVDIALTPIETHHGLCILTAIRENTEMHRLKTQLIQINEKLQQLACQDIVTELPNQLAFELTLNRELHKALRHDHGVSLLLLQLNPLPLGLEVTLLQKISQRLQKHLRQEDFLAKLADEQFAIILTQLPEPSFATRVAQKIKHALAKPFCLNHKKTNVTAQIGIANFPEEGNSPDSLVQQAQSNLS